MVTRSGSLPVTGHPSLGNAHARVAIVGGGYAGMAAAAELARNGVPVTVFETGRVLGGRARCIETDGKRLHNRLPILLRAYPGTLRLIELVQDPGGTFG